MAYSAPSMSASSQTFNNLQSRGFAGYLNALMTANSLTDAQKSLAESLFIKTQASLLGEKLRQIVDNFTNGHPATLATYDAELKDVAQAFAAVLAAINEIAALVDANTGYLDHTYTKIGFPIKKRFWS